LSNLRWSTQKRFLWKVKPFLSDPRLKCLHVKPLHGLTELRDQEAARQAAAQAKAADAKRQAPIEEQRRIMLINMAATQLTGADLIALTRANPDLPMHITF
jgi:hypothetical protein